MDAVISAFNSAKRLYDSGSPSVEACLSVVEVCLRELAKEAKIASFGHFSGTPRVPYVAGTAAPNVSRPFRPELFEASPESFAKLAVDYLRIMRARSGESPELVTRTIYTSVTAFSVCFDLWKPKSRKTPGTFFELLVGSTARLRFPTSQLSKHIPIRDAEVPTDEDLTPLDDQESQEERTVSGNFVSTDLVITNPRSGKGAVLPLKITTRERIVQPFAHQRILDSAYPGKFASFIACISEVQRDEKTQTVKQICVPGTIALFQKHLSKVAGLYYCDIPQRYARPDFTGLIAVRSFDQIFSDVDRWLE